MACSAGESSTPESAPSVAHDADQNADVDAGVDQNDAAITPSGTPCTVAFECPSFVCAKCPAVVLQECTGAHVCATEEQVCASITCDADGGGPTRK